MRNQIISTLLSAIMIVCVFVYPPAAAEEIFMPPEEYIANAFETPPEPLSVALDEEQRAQVKKILKRSSVPAQYTFWRGGDRTAIVLNEIGKYELITAGFLIDEGEISDAKILIYRESHGYEVQYPYFTNQFIGMRLNEKGKPSKRVNGISGATLSVNAVRNMAHLALYVDAIAAE